MLHGCTPQCLTPSVHIVYVLLFREYCCMVKLHNGTVDNAHITFTKCTCIGVSPTWPWTYYFVPSVAGDS